MMNVSRLLKIALPVAVAASLVVGCSPQAGQNAGQTPNQGTRINREGTRDVEIKTTPAERQPDPRAVGETRQPQYTQRAPKIATRAQNQGTSLNAQADSIAEAVTRIPGVERAVVLLAGRTALVGIDMAAQISGSKIDTIKFSVKEAVERTGAGYQAVVSSDIDTVTRVRTLINGMRQGKPVDTIGDEIADIISRLIPEI